MLTKIFPDKAPESIAFGLCMSRVCLFGAFQDAERTGNGLAHPSWKGWSRYPRLLRGALRALHDGEAAAVAHLPRRSPLIIPEASVDDAASDDDATDPNNSTNFHYSADVPPKSVKWVPILPILPILPIFTILPIFSPFYPFFTILPILPISTILPIFTILLILEPFYPFSHHCIHSPTI